MALGKLDFQKKKNEIGALSCTIFKNQVKMNFKNLSIEPETIKLLDESIRNL
jgi:hypothetical protein